LFKATNQINHFKNKGCNNIYSRLEINKAKSRALVIEYLTKFPLKGIRKVDFLGWVRVHQYQQQGLRLKEDSAKRLQTSLDQFHANDLKSFMNDLQSLADMSEKSEE
jgi:hypothetical protein